MKCGETRAEAIAEGHVHDLGLCVVERYLRLVEDGLDDGSCRLRKLAFELFDLPAEEHDRLAGGTHLLAGIAAKTLTPASDFVEFALVHEAIMSFRCKCG
jgi:hypothetical protein